MAKHTGMLTVALLAVLAASAAAMPVPVPCASPPPPPCGVPVGYTASPPPPPPPCYVASPPPPPPPCVSSPPPPPPPCLSPPPPPPPPPPVQIYKPPCATSSPPPPPPPCVVKASPPPCGVTPSPPPPCGYKCGMLALSYSPDLSIVSSLIVAAGPDIVAAFENPTYPFTFLAPVNSAFKGVDLAALKANNALLRQVLGNHILWQYSFPKDLLSINGLTITTLTSSTKVSFKAWSDSYGKVHASVSGPLPKCTVGKFLFKRYSGCQVVVQPITAVLY